MANLVESGSPIADLVRGKPSSQFNSSQPQTRQSIQTLNGLFCSGLAAPWNNITSTSVLWHAVSLATHLHPAARRRLPTGAADWRVRRGEHHWPSCAGAVCRSVPVCSIAGRGSLAGRGSSGTPSPSRSLSLSHFPPSLTSAPQKPGPISLKLIPQTCVPPCLPLPLCVSVPTLPLMPSFSSQGNHPCSPRTGRSLGRSAGATGKLGISRNCVPLRRQGF